MRTGARWPVRAASSTANAAASALRPSAPPADGAPRRRGAVEGRQRVDIQVVGLQRYHPLTVEPTFVNGWSWPSTVDRLLWLGGR